MTAALKTPADLSRTQRRALILWLGATSFLVFAMVVIGGLTRLTDSGLSITEWRPVTGAIPPLTEAGWNEEFDKYRASSEYQLQNLGMSMAEFRVIYWWEWGHRQLGRVLGLVYAVPLALLWLRGWLPATLRPRFLALLALGGLQGVVGWWMVASGLVNRVDVSHYRLATHLGLAFALLAALSWTLADVARPLGRPMRWTPATTAAAGLTALVFIQILLGALVAGLDAGRIHTDWPLMAGAWTPPSYGALTPWWRDALENPATVQFHHRVMGYGVAVAALGVAAFVGWGQTKVLPAARRWAGALGLLITAQVALGVLTLINAAPLGLSAAHQALAAVIFVVAALLIRASLASSPSRRADPKLSSIAASTPH